MVQMPHSVDKTAQANPNPYRLSGSKLKNPYSKALRATSI